MAVTTLDLPLGFPGRAPFLSARDKQDAPPSAVGYRRPRGAGDLEAARGNRVAEFEGGQNRERILADQALMALIADGDDTAFARVVGEVSPRLLRFARSMLANPAEAEEVVQEALLRLWRQARTWQPQGRISTWLHQVTFRLCVDSIRRRRPSVAIDTVEAELEDETPIPEERLVRIDEARSVRAAVERLPERQRIAVILCHYQNLSQAEGAAVMGVGEEAYESLLARARRRLRALLAAGEATAAGGKT